MRKLCLLALVLLVATGASGAQRDAKAKRPAKNVTVVVQTSPAGLVFSVDGVEYTSTRTFSWLPGSTHTIVTTSPQSRYLFSAWSDAGAISHAVVPSSAMTYTARFTMEAVPPPPIPETSGIWISQAEILALPMSGPAWDALLAWANDPSYTTPDLSNQDDWTNAAILAKALVFARTGMTSYRDGVVAALTSVVNSGTYSGRSLALGRELGSYVVAADIIDLKTYDASLDSRFRSKLIELRTTPTSSGPVNLVDCHEARPNNWGTHAGATLAAIEAYLGDTVGLARVAQVFKGYLGDRSSYAGFTYGADLSWQANPAAPVGINPVGATIDGHDVDGVLPDDQRRQGTFSWPPADENYSYEALQGALAQAFILYRAGYTEVFNWENQALRRAFVWLDQVNEFPATGDDSWQPYLVNYVYGTSLPAPVPSRPGKSYGFTDWTLQRW